MIQNLEFSFSAKGFSSLSLAPPLSPAIAYESCACERAEGFEQQLLLPGQAPADNDELFGAFLP